MSELSRAQKARLGFFVLLAVVILVIVVVVKVGESLFDKRDIYTVRMPGSVGALDPGSDVTFNGIVVGRVERVRIDPIDVGVVAIDLTLAADTPVPEDTRATVAMRGITGMKFVELTGGTNLARRRKPGEEIPSGKSSFDEIEGHAVGIAANLDGLLGDARAIVYGPSADHAEAVLASVRRTTESIEDAVTTSAPRVAVLIERADDLAVELTELLIEMKKTTVILRETAQTATASIQSMSRTVDRVGSSVDKTLVAFEKVGVAAERLTSQTVEPFIQQVTVIAKRAGADLRATLDAVVLSLDSVVALADMLRADPSSILAGRSLKERDLK